MPEIIGTFLRTDEWDERTNCSIEAWDSSRRNLAQKRLQFAEGLLDRIEIRRIFRQSRIHPAVQERLPRGRISIFQERRYLLLGERCAAVGTRREGPTGRGGRLMGRCHGAQASRRSSGGSPGAS